MSKINKNLLKSTILSLMLIIPLMNYFIVNPFLIELNQKDDISDKIDNIYQSDILENQFTYYKNITIDHFKISGTTILENFPFLLDIYDSDLHDYAQTDGDDIAFFNNSIKLDHEIVNFNFIFNNTHSHLTSWIRIPRLSPVSDTIIQMHFGNPTIESQENRSGVWDNNFRGVWHLDEDPNYPIIDSTIYGNHGTANANMNSNDLISGKINNALNFNGNTKFINCGNDQSINLTNFGTFEFWINAQTSSNSPLIFGNNIQPSWGFYQQQYTAGSTEDVQWDHNGYIYLNSYQFPINTWHQIVLTFNGEAEKVRIYDNGVLHSEVSIPPTASKVLNNPYPNPLYISDPIKSGFSSLDEVRLSSVNRSSDWIRTNYDNQNNPSIFCKLGQKEKITTPPLKPLNFNFSKIITIDHTKVNGSGVHKDFPLLIDLLDKDLHKFAQPDGRDIVFYNGTEWMDFEIEYYNQSYLSTHARLIAWIRIPYLSTLENTNFTMYFGNTSIISQQNPLGVWDNNYKGVWHLKEDPSEIIKDSSIYHNDGITYGSMTSESLIKGKVNGALNFNGINDYINVGNHSSLNFNTTSATTIEAWFLPIDNSTNQALINRYDSGAQSYRIFFSQGQIIATGGVGTMSSNNRIPLNSWQHLTVIIKGGIGKIYINGKLNSTSSSQITLSQPLNDVIFGCGWQNHPSTSYYYNGSLDEIRISNIERSPDWIATQYNNQFDPNSFYKSGGLRTAPQKFNFNSNATSPDTDGLFTLNWSESIGADNYSIYWDTKWIDDYYGYLNLLEDGLTNNSLSVQFSNGTYYFVAISYNETGSTLSNCIKIIIKLLPESFTINSNATNPDINGIFLINWNISNWAHNYSIYYSNNSFSDYTNENVSLLESGLTNYSLTINFTRGIYYFRVVAINDVGYFISNEIIVHVYPPPGKFSIDIDLASLDANGFILINWTSSEGALNYSLYMVNDTYIDEHHENLIIVEEGITNHYYDVKINKSGTYSFLILAFNEVGNFSATYLNLHIILPNLPTGENFIFIILIIIISSIVVGTIASVIIYKKTKSNFKFKDMRKDIPLKQIISHIEKIFYSSSELDNQKRNIEEKRSIIEQQEPNKVIIKLKQKVIELYLNGAYLESLKEIKKSLNYLKEIENENEMVFFSKLYDRINGLITERENKLTLLDEAIFNNKHQEVLYLFGDIIEISKELNDIESIEMYEYEMENYKKEKM